MTRKTRHSTAPGRRDTENAPHENVLTGTDGGFYEEIEHTADVALRCGGPDLETFFGNAARGMYTLMGAGAWLSEGKQQQSVALEATDIEGLLVDWLGELAYWAEAKGLVFEDMAFQTLTDTRLEAALAGGRVHRLERIIKAVTYHQLRVEKTAEGYRATVVFDV
jgi:SHS2 domain-containing protein